MGQGKLVLRRFGDSVTAETIGDLALAPEGSRQLTSCASWKRAPPPSISVSGRAGPSVPRPSLPRTAGASRHTGHATKGAARCSRRLLRTERLSDS
jgi:hypothetical protein